MNDSLWSNVHERTCGHLPVLGDAQRIEAFPVLRFGVVGDHHPVGHHHARRVFRGGEKPHRMTGIEVKRLLLCHLGQVLHGKQVLGPVLKYRSIATVGNQFLRMLCYRWIQVILKHELDGCCLRTVCRVFCYGSSLERIVRHKAVHVDAPVCLKFLPKFWSQRLVPSGRKIAQGVP